MFKNASSTLRCLVRNNVRFYRRKRPSNSHITALKDKKLLRDDRTASLDSNTQDVIDKRLQGLQFEELNLEKSLEDVMLGYFKHANTTFKRSSSNFKNLQKSLNAEGVTDNEKSSILFDYLLSESNLEIRRFETMDKEQLMSLHQNRKEDPPDGNTDAEGELEQSLVSGLLKSPMESETYLMNLDLVYEILTDLNNKKKPASSTVLSIEQLVEAFELAKIVPIEGRRRRGIFLAGNLIYSSGKVRMDPVNESFYIESLVNYGLYRKAYNLFETNREKVDERWWYEMGMMVALRANYLSKFERLLKIVDEKFNGYPYINTKVLKLAIKKKLLLRDFNAADALSTRLLQIVDTYGLNSNPEQARKTINFTSEDEADQYLNEIELPTSHDLLNVADYHLFRKNFNTAYKIMAAYLNSTGDSDLSYRYLILHMKLNLLRDIESLKNSLVRHMSPKVADYCLEKLQKTFNHVVKEKNIESSTCQDLLFDSVDSLVADPLLTKTVESLIVSSLQNKELSSPSKSFHSMLKLLLASGRETEAFKVLSNMEKALEKSQRKEVEHTDLFFPEANSHHYAEFIECYTLQAVKAKRQRAMYQKKVSDILDRMKSLAVPFNAVFLTKLIAFYRQQDDFEKAFSLINQILKEKVEERNPTDAERTTFYNRRDITRGLYAEIWKLCSRFYYAHTRELHTIDMKSNYGVWKKNTLKIMETTKVRPNFSIRTLFRIMVHDDNILPDERMYFIILVTFMKKRDWEAIPGILAAMVEFHGLPLSTNISNYLWKGLERERMVLERRKLKALGGKDQVAETKFKSFDEPGEKINSDEERVEQKQESKTFDRLVEGILRLQRYKNPDDKEFFLVSEALEELHFAPSGMQKLINSVHNRNEVM